MESSVQTATMRSMFISEKNIWMLEEGAWQKIFKVKPPVFTREEKTRMAGRHEGCNHWF